MVLDLTHLIQADMPVYPGTEPPRLKAANTLSEHGFAETLLTLCSHTGTHMDAPAHMIDGKPTLDTLSADTFVGRGYCFDISAYKNREVPLEALVQYQDQLEGCQWVLFYTGWGAYWESVDYFSAFPVLSLESTRWLVQKGFKGVGIDAISFDSVESTTFDNHMILLGDGMVMVENLKSLAALKQRHFQFFSFPLHFHNSDGAPVRAMAVLEE